MSFDAADFVGDPVAIRFAVRDLKTLDQVVAATPGKNVVVQAGGGLGVFPKRLAESFDAVYTFEPDPDMFVALTRNVPERNVIRVQAALGYRRGVVGMSRSRRDGSSKPEHMGLTHVTVDGAGHVPVMRIDDLGLPACDLIYLDIEGYEVFALQGARETISRCRPAIALEVGRHSMNYGLTEEDVHTSVRMLGYRNILRSHSDEMWVPEEWA